MTAGTRSTPPRSSASWDSWPRRASRPGWPRRCTGISRTRRGGGRSWTAAIATGPGGTTARRMGDFKARFYDQYQSAHVAPRKGEATLAQFRARVPIFDRHWGRLLPSDRQAPMLDVGCGSGGMVWWLQQRGYANAAGIDISPEQVAVARALGVAGVEQADLRDHLRRHPGA